jgi:hypothetical protein
MGQDFQKVLKITPPRDFLTSSGAFVFFVFEVVIP